MKWLLLIVLLVLVIVVVALWRRTQMASGTPAGADPASVASGQTLVPPPLPPAASVPPVFDPLLPVIPVEPHESTLTNDETPAPAETVDESVADESAVPEREGGSASTPPTADGR